MRDALGKRQSSEQVRSAMQPISLVAGTFAFIPLSCDAWLGWRSVRPGTNGSNVMSPGQQQGQRTACLPRTRFRFTQRHHLRLQPAILDLNGFQAPLQHARLMTRVTQLRPHGFRYTALVVTSSPASVG
ncbi:hypothetical protein [Paraburkholderia kirstenboschensis]|uniref:hypothetical protein n=1 Tax=Paraburkholderia kirstenboschensis TaxID=1245436 RepID=UPI000A7B1B8C|nr:hypothetical protein [Paraburkholderia kirstenboschensis]